MQVIEEQNNDVLKNICKDNNSLKILYSSYFKIDFKRSQCFPKKSITAFGSPYICE